MSAPRFLTLALFFCPLLAGAETKPEPSPQPPPNPALETLPRGQVLVEIFEHAPAAADASDPAPEAAERPVGKKTVAQEASWSAMPTLKTDEYREPAFAFSGLTQKYNARGARLDRSQPALVRASGVIALPPGEQRLLLRALTGARLAIDGKVIAQTEHLKRKGGDAEEVPDQAARQLVPGLHLVPPGHQEVLVTVQGTGQPQVLTLEAFYGGKQIRAELGELTICVETREQQWRLLTPAEAAKPGVVFDETGWETFADEQRQRLRVANAERRRNPDEEAYWKMRHDLARTHAAPAPRPPAVANAATVHNAIDAFLAPKLQQSGEAPGAFTEDAAFLRRVTLDTIGLLPTPQEVADFLADSTPEKRQRAIDRLLADARWADRWMPYWQDVLAENPNMLKGTLNNTGPFRWWLHEALLDNLPFDRFATELIRMEGSAQEGGPAGFALATQNDLPMAAKAQILSSALLAMEMKCARCHDAPNHPFDQQDLFKLAAMLQRKPLTVPATSLTEGLSADSHVVVSLKAGQSIDAHWPFAALPGEPLPEVLRGSKDSREQLAALVTDPRNARFAQVAVNRLWKEFLGFGLVEPVDDWESSAPANKELLEWLGHELATNDFDLKHVARLILNSHTYQRMPTTESSRFVASSERVFAAPARRRMTAEQLVDSLFAIAGKTFRSEPLTQDPECRQTVSDHGNLGVPRRAWEFTALSNERDRPALAKPRASVVTDVMETFGWRESRPEPRSTRDHEVNVRQPALLANGTMGSRIICLSEDSAWTALALEEQPLEALVRAVFERVFSRRPTDQEAARYAELLRPGYEERRTGAPAGTLPRPNARAVSWANHLNPEATRIVLAIEREVQAGDPATTRLRADWRERFEDVLWALILSPEFVWLP